MYSVDNMRAPGLMIGLLTEGFLHRLLALRTGSAPFRRFASNVRFDECDRAEIGLRSSLNDEKSRLKSWSAKPSI
jgi:hypothetical protein